MPVSLLSSRVGYQAIFKRVEQGFVVLLKAHRFNESENEVLFRIRSHYFTTRQKCGGITKLRSSS